jgi:amino acid transporter
MTNDPDKFKPASRITGILKRELTLFPLFGLIYFTVCGGAFGIEPLVGWSGPGMALLLIVFMPLVFSIPNMLMVREMSSMMPGEGGYYHWVKEAFGSFVGFLSGWMNWVFSWLDVSIYPVLAAYYLGYFIPPLRDGMTIGGVELSAAFLSWVVAAILIWSISYLNIRGARLAGLTTNWLGLVMIIPLVLMTVVGFYNWISSGTTIDLPFLPTGQNFIGAMSTGIFIAMWNFMGWELPTAAGDEIVNPKRTYPRAMALVLVAAILTYALPTIAGLYGGAGYGGRYQAWGIEEYETGVGIGPVMEEYGVTPEQMAAINVDPGQSYGWEFPDIAHAIGDQAAGINSPLSYFLGSTVMLAAVLSMIGLFTSISMGGTRLPFAMARDGMMPFFLTKVSRRFGTPWVSIVVCGIFYTIFSTNAFASLVVIDVFLNMLVLMAEFLALWVLRVKKPYAKRNKIPAGYLGLVYVTLFPLIVITLAIYSQVSEEGFKSIGWALIAIIIGAVLYFPIKKYVKRGIPDIDPFDVTHNDEY